MAIYKRLRKSKFYWCRFEFEGREIRQSTKCTNKKDAADFEASLRVQLNYRRIGVEKLGNKAAKPLAFNNAIADFLDRLKTKESTQRRYRVASKALIAFFGNAVVSSIEAADVEKFQAWRMKQTKKAPARMLALNPKAKLDKQIRPATVNREVMLLSGLYKWLVKTGKASTNPATGVEMFREDNIQNRIVSNDEFRAYLVAAGQPLQDVAVLLYHTGMRPGEVFSLKKDDLDFDSGTIRITSGKTEAARRTVEMSSARSVLSYRFNNIKGELLFPGGKNSDRETPIVKLTNAHLATIKRAEVKPFRIYDLRHSFATEFLAAGGDVITLAAILGHSRIEMTMRYAHPTQGHRAAAIQKLEDFRNSKTNIRAFQRTA